MHIIGLYAMDLYHQILMKIYQPYVKWWFC